MNSRSQRERDFATDTLITTKEVGIGTGLHRALKRIRPELLPKVTFITGDTMNSKAKKIRDSVGRPHIEKPITPQDVRNLVHLVIDAPG